MQGKLDGQATEIKSRTVRKYMLQSLIYDADGVVYSPTYSRKPNGQQHRYYISQNLLQYKDHPKRLFSRLPAGEFEKLINGALRDKLPRILPVDRGLRMRDHLLKHHGSIPSQDWVRGLVHKIVVDAGMVTITLKEGGLETVAKQHLGLNIPSDDIDRSDLTVPYKTKRARSGAIVIEPEGQIKDPLDMPEADLRKLIQGLIWRDEHFEGMALKTIAHREGCSEAYVGTAIFKGFDFLMSTICA